MVKYTKQLEEIDNYILYCRNEAYSLLEHDFKRDLDECYHEVLAFAIDAIKTKEQLMFTQKAQIYMAQNELARVDGEEVPWEELDRYNDKLILKDNKVKLLSKEIVKVIKGYWWSN